MDDHESQNHEGMDLLWIRCPVCGRSETSPRHLIVGTWACYAAGEPLAPGTFHVCSERCREALEAVLEEARSRGWSPERIREFSDAVGRTLYDRTRHVEADLWTWIRTVAQEPRLRYLDGRQELHEKTEGGDNPRCCSTCGQHRVIRQRLDSAANQEVSHE